MSRTRSIFTAAAGFTLVEALVATLIVGVMLTAVLTALGASKVSRAITADRAVGQQLAEDLLAEILQQSYQDPVNPDVFGLEPGKSATNRATWTDVDDYNGLSESPPQTKSGTVLTAFPGWSRSVVVQWIDPATLNPTASANTGIKQITVTVTHGSKPVAVLATYRTLGWVDTIPSPTTATGNHPPVAAATVDNTSQKAGKNANFNGSGSSDPDGDTLSYVWNFGDGATSNLLSPTHAYAGVGTYNATLTVYDGRGGVGIGTITMTIHN